MVVEEHLSKLKYGDRDMRAPEWILIIKKDNSSISESLKNNKLQVKMAHLLFLDHYLQTGEQNQRKGHVDSLSLKHYMQN